MGRQVAQDSNARATAVDYTHPKRQSSGSSKSLIRVALSDGESFGEESAIVHNVSIIPLCGRPYSPDC